MSNGKIYNFYQELAIFMMIMQKYSRCRILTNVGMYTAFWTDEKVDEIAVQKR
jgi:hypothetical protein